MRTRLLSCVFLSAAALCACREERVWLAKSHASIALYEAGRFEEALVPAEEGLKTARERFGPDDLRTAYALDHAGKTLMRLGRLVEARPYLEEALAAKERTLDPADPRRAYYLLELGELEARLGAHDAAEGLYQRALELYRGAYGEISLPSAMTHARLGALYRAWGLHEEAERTLRRAEAINGRLEGLDAGVAAAVDASLCGIFAEDGRSNEAAGRCAHGVAGLRTALPPGHADIARALSDEGLYLLRSGKLAAAREDLERAMEVHLRHPGCDPPGYLSNRLAWAELLEAEGKTGEAETVLAAALARFEGSHAAVKALLRGADFYARRKQDAMGETLYRSALLKHEESPMADRIDREAGWAGLIALYARTGRRPVAERLLERAWKEAEAFEGPRHRALAEALIAYSAASLKAGDLRTARRDLERLERLLTRHFPSRDPFRIAASARAAALRARLGGAEEPRSASHRTF